MALIEDIKNLLFKVENSKDEEIEKDLEEDKENIKEEEKKEKELPKNEVVNGEDKRKLIDEIGGILKGKIDDELIRTIIGKAEKLAYTEEKKEIDNKCKNSIEEKDTYQKVNEIMNSKPVIANEYISLKDRIELGNKYFD